MAGLNFFEINTDPPPIKQNLYDFLLNIEDQESKYILQYMFDPYRDIIFTINLMFGVYPSENIPELLIHKDSDLMPQTVYGMIEMGDRYILKYLDIVTPAFNEVVEDYKEDFSVEGLGPIVSFMWTYCHEYFHFVRRHEDVKAQLQTIEGEDFNERLTDYCLEMDADLCAIAMVYRYLQRWHKDLLPDLIIRQLSLFLIFYTMRPHLELTHSDRHLSMGLRLHDLVTKLSILTEIMGADQEVDQGMVKPETKQRYSELSKSLGMCERLYNKNAQHNKESELLALLDQDDIDGMLLKVKVRWETVRVLVRDLSGTLA